jgi:N-succinyldiaminopimelate aminotransferase
VPSRRAPYLTAKLQGFGTTIFAEMSALATATGSVNLGQGFPDTDGPRVVLDAAIDAINGGLNQYPPGPGMPVLRQAVSAHQQRFYGLQYDPDTEVLVTAGATEGLAAALLGLLDTGDEVVAFEPMFDSYQPCIALAGAVVRPVPLRPPTFSFDPDMLRAAITPKTKLLLLNTPHNPTGKVFDRAEMQTIADLAIEHDLIVVTDEVYEHLVFDGAEHIAMASLPGMRDRTLSISSGGKTFNTTGWKIGWLCGPAHLVTAARSRMLAIPSKVKTRHPDMDIALVNTMEFDPLRDEGLLYAMQLLRAGVSVEVHSYPGTFHGSAIFPARVSRQQARDSEDALRRALR